MISNGIGMNHSSASAADLEQATLLSVRFWRDRHYSRAAAATRTEKYTRVEDVDSVSVNN
jgi:hypothetical protein